QIELRGAELVGQEVTFNEHRLTRRHTNRMSRFVEHRARDVDAGESPNAPKRLKITAGPASQIEHIDLAVEAVAHGPQPAPEACDELPMPDRVVRGAILLRVRIAVQRRGTRAPTRRRAHANSSSAGTKRTPGNLAM